jgi:hypothetical protein
VSDLGLLSEAAYAAKRRATAEQMFHFFKGLSVEMADADVTLDRDRLILYMDAFRSADFMHLIEVDEDMPHDIKVQTAQWVSGLNKNWSLARAQVYRPEALRFAAVIWKMVQMADTVQNALGIRVVVGTKGRDPEMDVLPTDLTEDGQDTDLLPYGRPENGA